MFELSILGLVKTTMTGVPVKALAYIIVIGVLLIAFYCAYKYFQTQQALKK